MDKNGKVKSKFLHWIARICTTFGLAGLTWLYLYWFDLAGGVFLLGALCALTSYEFLATSPEKVPLYRSISISVISFFTPFFFHRTLEHATNTSMTILVFEIFLAVFIILTLLALKNTSVLKVISKSVLFPVWGISLPLTSLIFIAHYFIANAGYSHTQALLWVVMIIFVTKATDIGALLVGSWLGKNKLAPKTSPGKTIEGAIGGVVVSVLVALVVFWISQVDLNLSAGSNSSPIWIDVLKVIVATTVIAIMGIWGDLFESSWKRHIEIKNSGSILPGLGGMYDLTDSIILASPTAYFLIKYVVTN